MLPLLELQTSILRTIVPKMFPNFAFVCISNSLLTNEIFYNIFNFYSMKDTTNDAKYNQKERKKIYHAVWGTMDIIL